MSVTWKLDTTRLDEISEGVRPKASEIVVSSAFEIQGIAQLYAPVDTAALKNGIETDVAPDRMSAVIHDSVDYGIFQELGTSKMQAQPFLTPAVETVRPKFERRWAELFE